jgi:hypothetical protein
MGIVMAVLSLIRFQTLRLVMRGLVQSTQDSEEAVSALSPMLIIISKNLSRLCCFEDLNELSRH